MHYYGLGEHYEGFGYVFACEQEIPQAELDALNVELDERCCECEFEKIEIEQVAGLADLRAHALKHFP